MRERQRDRETERQRERELAKLLYLLNNPGLDLIIIIILIDNNNLSRFGKILRALFMGGRENRQFF